MRGTFGAALAAIGCIAVIAMDDTASAQGAGSTTLERASPPRARAARVRPRIVVRPTSRLYRHCVDEYVIERRATGDTVVPNMRCWWAYR